MKKYTLKSIGKNTDYMTIIREMEDGFVVKIVRDLDGYEDVRLTTFQRNFLIAASALVILQKLLKL